MNVQRMGLWALVALLLVDFGQVHRMVPGLSALKPGLVTQLILLGLVLLELHTLRWLRTIAAWRLLFLGAIATGLVLGVTEGRVALILKTELPRYLTAFLGTCLFVRRIRDLRLIHNLFILMAFLIAAYVLTHGGHGPGLIKDENDAALVLVMFLPFAFLKIFFDASSRGRMIALAVFFTALLAIGLTLSRGGMVGAIPALIFCWLKSRNKALGLGLGAAALAGALVLAPPSIKEEFTSIGNTEEGTAGTRRYFWDLSVQMFEERPLFGVGASCWGNALYSGLIEEPERRAHMTPHSIYFQVITELGAVGTFFWMGMLAAVFYALRSLRADRLNADAGSVLSSDPDPHLILKLRADLLFMRNFIPAVTIGIVGYLVCGAFLSVLYYPGLPLFAALVQASVEAWRTEMAIASAVTGAGAAGNAAGVAGDSERTAVTAAATSRQETGSGLKAGAGDVEAGLPGALRP